MWRGSGLRIAVNLYDAMRTFATVRVLKEVRAVPPVLNLTTASTSVAMLNVGV